MEALRNPYPVKVGLRHTLATALGVEGVLRNPYPVKVGLRQVYNTVFRIFSSSSETLIQSK